LPPVTKEIQEVKVDAAGGTFTVTFDGQATAPLPFDAPKRDLEAALEALSSVSGQQGDLAVSGGPGNVNGEVPYFVSFGGGLAGANVVQMTADSTALTGGAHTATVDTTTTGMLSGKGDLAVFAANVGGAASVGVITAVIGPLPLGITTAGQAVGTGVSPSWNCPGGAGQSIVTCTSTKSISPLSAAEPIRVPLNVDGVVAAPASSVPLEVSGGGVTAPASGAVEIIVSATPAAPGIQAFMAGAFDINGQPAVQAGAHPYGAIAALHVNTRLAADGRILTSGDLRDSRVDLPPGFVGNPLITKRCPQNALVDEGNGLCNHSESQIGDIQVMLRKFGGLIPQELQAAIDNDVPPKGYPAQFTGIFTGVVPQGIVASLRSDEDFGVSALAPNVSNLEKVYGAIVFLHGFPAGAAGKPFFSNPTNCNEGVAEGRSPAVKSSTRSWIVGDVFSNALVDPQPLVVGCNLLDFKPEFTFQPSTERAATGTAGTALLSIDQSALTDPDRLATAHLKKSVVALPEGVVLNPAAADGLQACSTQQIGLKGTGFPEPNPIRFDMSHPSCPDGSKIGTAEVVTPLLDAPLAGTVYLAAQDDNPFKSLLAMYLVVDDEQTGTLLKLPGLVSPDASTGQLTATFDNNPQLPFSSLKLNFRGSGPRSTLATPDICGKYTTKGTFTPWSAPESGPPAQTEDSFNITTGVGGSASCPQTKAQRTFALGFEAGTTNPVAGGHSPFTLRITRPDGNQELNTVSVSTPPGFAATLKGVDICSDAAVAAAGAASRTGKAEMQNPSCPASSQVGTTTIGAGVGSNPFYVKTGKVYLTGPFKGAPLSFAFIVPAVAGPFDLGVQVVRTALRVNPVNAQITAESDPIPQILKGIPLQIRDVRVDIDRPGFALNPTNCEAMAVSGQVTGGSGAVANLSNRFQVGNCEALGFKPDLTLQLHGGTKRGKYQRVIATVTAREGDASLSRAAVTFPHSAFLAQEHLDKVCTRIQFAAKACPAGSIYGYARGITPLLDESVQGPVYLRSNPEHELPDLVAALRGPDRLPIEVELQIRTDSKDGGIRNTVDIVPDVPVSMFTMEIKGGKHALIVNSRDLCKGKKQKATVRFNAQNGKVRNFRTVVKNDCGKKGRKSSKKSSASKSGRGSSSQARLHR
jgi:hypothetical protein